MGNYLIIGGSSTVGISIVQDLLSKGHKVFASFFQTPIDFNHPNLTTFEWDVKNEWNSENVPDERIDGFVYCVGAINLKPFRGIKLDDFRNDLDIQVFGAVRALQGNLKKLKKSSNASVVLISSIAVQTGFPFHAMIGVSKGAVEGLVRNLASEFAPQIRVNGIAPSIVESRMSAVFLNKQDKKEMIASKHPLKRIGKSEDIGKTACFLLSSDSSWMTGQILSVDGGRSNLA